MNLQHPARCGSRHHCFFICGWFSGFSIYLMYGQLKFLSGWLAVSHICNYSGTVQRHSLRRSLNWNLYCCTKIEERICLTLQTKFAIWIYAECPNISLITDLLCTVWHVSNEYHQKIQFLNTNDYVTFSKIRKICYGCYIGSNEVTKSAYD